jgi:hypothetical protein
MESRELESEIGQLEVDLDRLRALYEQYFLGMEKLEPLIPRKQVERKMRILRKERVTNTALRFRLQMLIQRYSTMLTYWQRVSRQIEEGTYRPDVMKARARAETRRTEAKQRIKNELKRKRGEVDEGDGGGETAGDAVAAAHLPPAVAARDAGAPTSGQSIRDTDVGAAAAWTGDEGSFQLVDEPPPKPVAQPRAAPPQAPFPAVPPPVPAATRRPPPPPPPPAARPVAPPPPRNGLSDSRLRSIYDDYIVARQQCSQPTAEITFEKVSAQLKGQEELLRTKHGKAVDFEVSVRAGKAVLRAVSKK